jgi:hypothetical protein
VINIFEYHFIITKGNIYRNDLTAKNYLIKAKSDRDAWIIATSLAHDDLNRNEHIEKIKLIEVE